MCSLLSLPTAEKLNGRRIQERKKEKKNQTHLWQLQNAAIPFVEETKFQDGGQK